MQITPDEPLCRARIVDLSVEGCLLVLLEPQILREDTLVELTFCVNNLPFRVRAQAKSIRTDAKIGFQFPHLSERVRLQLEDLIEELKFRPLARLAKRTASRLSVTPKTGSSVANRKTNL